MASLTVSVIPGAIVVVKERLVDGLIPQGGQTSLINNHCCRSLDNGNSLPKCDVGIMILVVIGEERIPKF